MRDKAFRLLRLFLSAILFLGVLPPPSVVFAAETEASSEGHFEFAPLNSGDTSLNSDKLGDVSPDAASPSDVRSGSDDLTLPFPSIEASDNRGSDDADQEPKASDAAPVSASAQAATAAPRAVHELVTAASLMETNKEVLSLRQNVWDGALHPSQFYGEVEHAFLRRYGRDYGSKIRRFLKGEAAVRSRPEDAVHFETMSEGEREAFFESMPKGAELHIHFTGAGSPGLWMGLWKEFDTQLPTDVVAAKLRHVGESPERLGLDLSRPTVSGREASPKLRAALGKSLVTSQYDKTMDDFISKWLIIRPISKNPRAFYPLLKEVARSAREQNISYIEGLAPSDPPLVAAVVAAARKVEAETGVVIRVLANSLWGQKAHDVDTGMKTAHGLLDKGVVGFNMVADEFRNRPLAHYPSFRRLHKSLQGLHVTLHAGEVRGSADNIVNSLLLGTERLGHATQVLSNPIAMALLYANKIPVEASLISNLNTRAISDFSRSPLPKMIAWGVPVILSTDDPGIFSSTLSEEYEAAQRAFNLSWGELKQISKDGLHHSFLDEATKARLSAELDAKLTAFERSEIFLKFKR